MEIGCSWLIRKCKPRHSRHFGEHSHWYLVAFFLSSSSLCWSVAALRASLSVYWLWQYSLISWRACLVLSGLKLRSISLHRDFSSVIKFHCLHTLQERHRRYFSCMKKAKHRGSWFKRTDHWHKIKQLSYLRYGQQTLGYCKQWCPCSLFDTFIGQGTFWTQNRTIHSFGQPNILTKPLNLWKLMTKSYDLLTADITSSLVLYVLHGLTVKIHFRFYE